MTHLFKIIVFTSLSWSFLPGLPHRQILILSSPKEAEWLELPSSTLSREQSCLGLLRVGPRAESLEHIPECAGDGKGPQILFWPGFCTGATYCFNISSKLLQSFLLPLIRRHPCSTGSSCALGILGIQGCGLRWCLLGVGRLTGVPHDCTFRQKSKNSFLSNIRHFCPFSIDQSY